MSTHVPFTDRQQGPTYFYCSAANRKSLSIPTHLLKSFCGGAREQRFFFNSFFFNQQKHSTHPRLKLMTVKSNPLNSVNQAVRYIRSTWASSNRCQEPFSPRPVSLTPLFCNQIDSIPKILNFGLHTFPMKQEAGRVYLPTTPKPSITPGIRQKEASRQGAH